MSDEFGAVELPIPVPVDTEPVTDPGIAIFGAYLKAMLVFYAGDAWAVRAPSEPLVKTLLFCDPEEAEFIETDLPALYLWRQEIDTVYLAEQHTANRSKISALWVPPPKLSGYRWAERAPIISGIAKAFTAALDLDRHPAWVLAGDPDPLAATLGSVWLRMTGFVNAFVEKVLRRPVVAELGEGKRVQYAAFGISLRAEEHLDFDPRFIPAVYPSALDVSVVTPDYELLLQEAIAPFP
jgi:hypothetical protein